jgi:hypothetical protein
MQRIQPDRAALEIAWGKRKNRPFTLEQMLADKTQRSIIENEARKHMKQRDKFDLKKHQANDID